MNGEKMERDPELGALLARASGEAPVEQVDWDALRARILEESRAAARVRGGLRWRVRGFVGTAMAASVALLFLLAKSGGPGREAGTAELAGGLTLDEVLTSEVSDDELRALLSGAGNAEALLLLAAAENDEGER